MSHVEIRRCNECGEEWPDDGNLDCDLCGSSDTEIIECNRCHEPNPDPTHKFCPDCLAYCRYHNRKSRKKRAKSVARVRRPPQESNEVLKSPRPYDELPRQGLRCRPTEREGWYEVI